MTRPAYEAVLAARSDQKITTRALMTGLVDHFLECHGDRTAGDDAAVIGGIGELNGRPVTVIGIQKGQTLAQNQQCHFGCPEPEGYRKAQRLMQQAARFGRPVITLINTPGAFPDVHAEHHGQGEAIAQCLLTGASLPVPYLSVIVGEGGSGGALALAGGDEVWMFEDSIYSVLSPEGYASILWKDAHRASEAAEQMRLTAQNLYDDGVIDRVIPEVNSVEKVQQFRQLVSEQVAVLSALPVDERLSRRRARFRKF